MWNQEGQDEGKGEDGNNNAVEVGYIFLNVPIRDTFAQS